MTNARIPTQAPKRPRTLPAASVVQTAQSATATVAILHGPPQAVAEYLMRAADQNCPVEVEITSTQALRGFRKAS